MLVRRRDKAFLSCWKHSVRVHTGTPQPRLASSEQSLPFVDPANLRDPKVVIRSNHLPRCAMRCVGVWAPDWFAWYARNDVRHFPSFLRTRACCSVALWGTRERSGSIVILAN
jgi:hypothetical protein